MPRPIRPVPIAILAAVALAALVPTAGADEAGYLGVFLGAPEPVGDGGEATVPKGIRVLGVADGGPAAAAGLRARDRIVAVEGTPVTSPGELIARVKGLAPGSWVSVSVDRRGRTIETKVRLDERPASTSRLRMVQGWIGAEAIDLPPSLRSHFGAPEDAGVMISAVEEGSPAESAGLYLGDVVYDIDGEPVESTGGFRRLLVGGGVGNTVEMTVVRDGAEIVLETTIERAPDRATESGIPIEGRRIERSVITEPAEPER